MQVQVHTCWVLQELAVLEVSVLWKEIAVEEVRGYPGRVGPMGLFKIGSLGHLGGSAVECLPSTQGVTLEFQDRVPCQALCK